MKMSIEKAGGLLTISQRLYSQFLLYFVRITGILLLTGGGIGLPGVSASLAWNPDSPLTFFSKDLLIVNMIFTIGLAMVWAGFSSVNMLRYAERIIFNNPDRRFELFSPASADKPLYIPYDNILNIFRFTEIKNERGRDTYSISLMLKDGAEFWITGNVADVKKIFAIAEEISAHSGIPFTESDSNEAVSIKDYSEVPVPDDDLQASPYLNRTDAPDGNVFSISRKKFSIAGLAAGAYIYLVMATVPFFLMNMFLQQSIPAVVHYLLYVFVALWWGILTGGIIISLKDFKLKVNNTGITLVMRLKFFRIKLKEIFIPRGSISAVRTNRFEYGISTLSIGLSGASAQISKAAGMFINSSTLRTRQSTGIFSGNSNVLHLWELQPLVLPGKGPDIGDLRIIEKYIQTGLRL
jgi:hypothetical protein